MLKDKKNKRNGFLFLCIGIIVTFALVVLLEFFVMVIANVAHIQGILDLLKDSKREYTVNGTLDYAAVGVAQELGFLAGPILVMFFWMKKRPIELGLTSLKKDAKQLVIGLLTGLISMSVIFFILVACGSIKVISFSFINPLIFVVEIVIYILVGIAEEIFSRGLFMTAMRMTGKKLLVFLVPSIFFGLMHLANNGVSFLSVVNLIVLGLVFAYAFYKTGTIWMSIGIHMTWNMFQGILYGFYVSGNKDVSFININVEKYAVLNGGNFGPEGGLAVTFVSVALLIFIHYFFRKSQYDFMSSGCN